MSLAGLYAAIVAVMLYVQYNLLAGLAAYYALYWHQERHGYRAARRRGFYVRPRHGGGFRRVRLVQ